ncbi:hypothetical protein ILUMI_15796, partial [Ignelater luminosus]
MAASNKFNINPFDGSNFHNWKFRMRRILDEYGVLSSIENEVDNKDANATKNDKKAMSLIVQCVNDGQLEILMEKKSSYSMWKALCNVYEKKEHKARYCYNRFGGKEKSTIQNHYHNNQQYSRVENQNYPGRFVNYRRTNRFVNQPRHLANRQNQNQIYKHSNYMEADNKGKVCFVSENKHDLEEDREEHDLKFFVGSGCTDHLVKDDSYFSFYVPLKKSIKIAVAKNGGFINASGVGNIKAVSYFAKKKTECEIKNVLHVPELRRNLLSVKKLEMNGMTVKFENGEVKLLNKNGDCFGSRKRDKLYEIEFKVEKLGCYETEIENEELTTWHQRLGHMEYTTLEKLIKRKMVE